MIPPSVLSVSGYQAGELVLILILLATLARTAIAEDQLPTLVSTNLCADLVALSLAHPRQILSVSQKSQDPARSPYVAQAQQYLANTGGAEEIIHLQPDIVLASRRWKSHPQGKEFLRLGIDVIVLPPAASWPEIIDTTQWLADRIGRTARGEQVVHQLAQRLAALKRSARPLSVLYLRPTGGSAGSATFVNTVMKAAGIQNHAGKLGLKGWGNVPLERILMEPPDAFLISNFVRDNGHEETRISRHPVLTGLLADKPRYTMNNGYWSCDTWHLIHAAEHLRKQITTSAGKPS